MLRRSIPLLTLALVLALTSSTPIRAQHRLQPVAAVNGRPALELMLRKLDTVGNLTMTTAHPDDENNALLAYYGHTKGFRTSLVTATRGEGGQNEIGPELFEALAVLRTEELLAAHRYDGAEQYFTSAVDFGFSFSVEESLEKWGGHRLRRRGRRTAPSGLGPAERAGVSRRRRSECVPRSDRRRAATVAGQEVLLHSRILRAARQGPAAHRRGRVVAVPVP
jgi:hypothetical protein